MKKAIYGLFGRKPPARGGTLTRRDGFLKSQKPSFPKKPEKAVFGFFKTASFCGFGLPYRRARAGFSVFGPTRDRPKNVIFSLRFSINATFSPVGGCFLNT